MASLSDREWGRRWHGRMIKGCFLSIVFAIVLFVSRHLYWGLFFLFFIAPLFFAFAVFLGMDEELTKKRRER